MHVPIVGVVLVLVVAAAGCSGAQPRAVRAQARAVATSVQAPPVWLESPQMTSPATGWTLRLTTWGFSYSELVRTTDGGRTWTDVTPLAAAALLSMPDVLPPVLLARDGEHAWLAICCTGQTDTSAGMLTEVFSTSDGGRTWTESGPLHGPAYGGPQSLSFTGPDDGWLLLITDPAGPYRFGQLYRTDDGGRRWTRLAADVPPSCEALLTAATTSVAWIVCGLPGPLLISRDGGTRWVPQPLPGSAVGGVPQFFGQTGFLTAGSSLLVTHDLGRTWRRLPLPSGIGRFPSIQFLSPADGIVMPYVSPGSRVPLVYITVNGGRIWTAVPQGLRVSDPELLGYDYVSTRTWFAWYGNEARTRALASTIYETRDSGRTWTAITGRL
jgi:photosystem II stability/assembly factor-like uncharacterized protein